MAANERRALGRGLGSLIPERDAIVSRETISREESVGRPSDLFFAGGSGKDSGERRSQSLSADLLKPTPRKGRPTRSKSSSAKGATKSDAAVDARSKRSTKGASSSKKSSRKGSLADSVKVGRNQDGSEPAGDAGTKKRPLFADIIPEDPGTANTEATVASGESEFAGKETVTADLEAAATTQGGVSEASGSLEAPGGATEDAAASDEDGPDLVQVPGVYFALIDVDLVVPNPKQPREIFDEFELAELSESIKEIGVLQPIVVREIDGTTQRYQEAVEQRKAEGVDKLPKFELIMGERRLRASKLAGAETIPAIVRNIEDDELLREALVENLHRTQLNPIEEANAYAQLMSDFGYTQQELSERIKRSRPQIANSLRLLKLPPSVQRKLAAGVLSAGHARALLALPNIAQMDGLADRIIAEGLSVRTTEEIVALGEVSTVAAKKSAKRIARPLSENASSVVERLTDLLDTRVTVVEGKHKGRISIEYAGPEDLERITQVIANLRG